MAEVKPVSSAVVQRSSHRAIAVGLHEAALDSPTFRATAAHFADQIDAVERWLNGYVTSTSKVVHDILALEETINSYLTKTIPSAADGVIDNDYTFLALKRVGDGSRECLMQLISSTKRMESTVAEPIRAFLTGDLRNFKEIRKVLENTQRSYDSTLARYLSQSKTKEPSHLREDAFSVYETRKAYLQASMDFCQLAPQVRFVMDKLLVKVAGDMWKEMKRGREAAVNATRWEKEMERVHGWSGEMEASESVFRHELQAARRDLGETALTGCKPSRELDDYSASTVPFLGSRGPMSLGPRGDDAVISEKQGWLYLRTISGKPARHNWVRRWYYCRESVFGWLIPGPQGVLQGDEIGVLLCNARPAPGEDRRFCLEVKTKSQTMLLQAETQAELTEWLEVFDVTKKKAFEASMGRDGNPDGSADPAFSINPPTIPEFSARVLDAQLGLTMDDVQPSIDRSSTLAIPPPEGMAGRSSMDVNNSLSRRTITALSRDLVREEGESSREHAARIIQKLELHRKATFGAGAEAALASTSGSAGGVASLIAASHNLLPASANSANLPRSGNGMLPSVDSHPGTLAPLTLAKPPAVTSLSRTAVLTAGQRDEKVPTSVIANYWGSNTWGTINAPPPDPILPRLDEDDPVGVVVSPNSMTTPLSSSFQTRDGHDALPQNYPPELRLQHGQFRLLFPDAPPDEKLVLVFRAAWASSPSTPNSNVQPMSGDGRIYVTPDRMYFYGEKMGLITTYSLSLDMISAVTATAGKESDSIFLHLGHDTNDTGYATITLKIFLDDLQLLHTRLNMLLDDLQAEVPMGTEAIVASLINVEREGFERASPVPDQWPEGPDDNMDHHDDGSPTRKTLRSLSHEDPASQMPSMGLRLAIPSKVNLPTRPVEFEPDDTEHLAAERHFEISAKSCFHVLFGDRSFVFPKLYFERRAQQIAQGPWVPVEQGRMRREFQFKMDHRDLFGRTKTMDVMDYQTIDMHKEHVTYVVTHAKTAWHLPHSQNLRVMCKIVITFVAKSKCRLAIYLRVDWTRAPALSKNLVERQALRDAAGDAEELAELATEHVRKLGARSRTLRAIQMYGGVGQQKKMVVFSPAGTDASRKQAIKPRTLTTLIWETVRSFGESAVTSLIMWAFAGIKKLFEIVTTQRLLLALLGLSIVTNLAVTSNEAGAWLSEKRAASMMRTLGIGPNTVMSRAIYMADLAEVSGGNTQPSSFPQESTCFESFREILDTTDMDAPWEEAGTTLASPASRATARRLRHTRQRLGTYRHDLVVAMRVVNSVEREVLQSEWENWLINEVSLCEDLDSILHEGGKTRAGDEAETVIKAIPSGRREALEEWQTQHCGSCKADYTSVMTERKMSSSFQYTK